MCVGLVLVVVFSVLASPAASSQELDSKCDAGRPSPLTVSVNSHLNSSGHWISKVELRRRARWGQKASTVDVEHSTVQCAGSDETTLNIALIFTAPGVPKDYELFPGLGLYKFHADPANWTQARQICAEEDAHLVILNSEKESDVIKTLFARYPTITGASHNEYAWVGIYRLGEGYFTVLGGTLGNTGFERWDPEQPHRGAEYCILVNRTTGGLADITCDWKQAFICEHN